jgi:hypothetical protein
MAYETKNNSGSMFKNTRKERETHADMSGEIMVDGKLYWLNGWRKIDKNGNPWYSVSVRDKSAKPQESKTQSTAVDDDIPF